MPTSPKSTTTNPSATAGARPSLRPVRWRRAARRLADSFTLKLVALIGIFVALPIVLYGQFESADRQMRDLVTRAIRDRSALIADALTPVLLNADRNGQVALNEDLAKYSSDGTVLKLMFQPGEERHAGRFYFVASAPQLKADEVAVELDELSQRGILQRLSDACTWGRIERNPLSANQRRRRAADRHHPDPHAERVLGPDVDPHDLGVPQHVDRPPLLGNARSAGGGGDLPRLRPDRRPGSRQHPAEPAPLPRRCRRDQRRPYRRRRLHASQRGARAVERRREFDKLVHALRDVSQQIRQSAEDKAHSFKTPLATIRSALEPVRRAVPEDNVRARRALELVDSALARLLNLVVSAQRQDIDTAEIIEAPRLPTDLSQVVSDGVLHLRELLATKDVRVVRRLDGGAIVRAGHGMLEDVLQSVLENAISFSPPAAW